MAVATLEKLLFMDFKKPTEVRKFPKGKMELLDLDGRTVGKFTFEPGWKWSEHLKPTAGTDWCEVDHFVYLLAGRMLVKMKDGSESEIGPDTVVRIPAGHDGWVLGSETAIALDFEGAEDYAK